MPTSSIGYWCSIVAHQYFDRLRDKLGHLDINNWYYVLLTIDENKSSLSQQELADVLDLDKVAMMRAVDHLSREGYIERCDCAGDRRKYIVKLTAKAKPAVKAIRRAYGELNDEALKGMNKVDRARFQEQLDMLIANLRPSGTPTRITTKRIRS